MREWLRPNAESISSGSPQAIYRGTSAPGPTTTARSADGTSQPQRPLHAGMQRPRRPAVDRIGASITCGIITAKQAKTISGNPVARQTGAISHSNQYTTIISGMPCPISQISQARPSQPCNWRNFSAARMRNAGARSCRPATLRQPTGCARKRGFYRNSTRHTRSWRALSASIPNAGFWLPKLRAIRCRNG